MYVISLVFFGFAVRKYKDKYIPAALAMMLWFFLTALLQRPTELLIPYLNVVGVAEKVVFAVMTALLLMLCVLRKKPFALDVLPFALTVLAAAIRVFSAFSGFALQAVLCSVAVWHIWWMSKPRFIR